MPDVARRITEILGAWTKQPIVPGALFGEDLGFDSLDSIEALMAVEEEFGIEITDEQAHVITTVGELVEHVESRTGKEPS